MIYQGNLYMTLNVNFLNPGKKLLKYLFLKVKKYTQ